MPPAGPKFPVEFYKLVVQELDHSSLIACSRAFKIFWKLARPLLFRHVIVKLGGDSESSFHKRKLLLELLEDEKSSILGFIRSIKIEVLEDPLAETKTEYPPSDDPINAICKVLCTSPELTSINIQSNPELAWELLPEPLKNSLSTIFRASSTTEIILHRLSGLPVEIFQNDHLQTLELNDCRAHRSWWSNPTTKLKALNLTKLSLDTNFPILDIYSEPNLSDKKPACLPYNKLKHYFSKMNYREPLRLEVEMLKRSAPSLETVKLNYDGFFSTDDYLEKNEILPVLDLGICKNLETFEFNYKRPYDSLEDSPCDLATLCDKFLRPSCPVQSLKSLIIRIVNPDDQGFFTTSNSRKDYWLDLDKALAHENFASVKIEITVIHCLLSIIDSDYMEEDLEDVQDESAKMGKLGPFLERRMAKLFPALLAKDPTALHNKIVSR